LLTGTVLDSVSRQPVAYATVLLLPARSDRPLTGVTADNQGHFIFTKLGAGVFRLQVSFVGYATRSQPVTVTAGTTAVGIIELPAVAQRLAEVQALFYGALPTPELQGRGAAGLYYTIGVKKTVLLDQADLTLNATDPFNAYIPYRSTTTTGLVAERNEFRGYQRSLRLGFTYRFGQQQQGRKRKQVTNDDQKSSEGRPGGN
jgi:hypothetical protein